MGKIFQFWRDQIILVSLLALFSSVLVVIFSSNLGGTPRTGMSFLAMVFSTLLGLTFAAFSIIGAFMPNIERDFLNTHTFETFETTFKLTIIFELFSLTLAIVNYFIFGTEYFRAGVGILLVSVTIALGLMAYLMNKTFKVFRITRKHLIGP